MFEIRVICAPTEADEITKALSETFATSAVRQLPARDGDRVRLYVTGEQQPSHWPAPETAYATAPSIISEIGWTFRGARDCLHGIAIREFWLRKAALLDRIALTDDDPVHGDAATLAVEAARRLMEIDHAAGLGPSGYADGPYTPDHPDSIREPRGYVRQEYALWIRHH
ncbi:hypothetical protein [Streptomyces sp. NBC_01294]|uniref:hypothetical protein n=1 Tax=Streptomyces sp. NBC_01294 TaxID=2903815 RepID=UPI002DDBB469|nr:hypothetical protein [Streptomyces sp. NBC_01294]WRZ59077.1 hypothetical protein OG534_22855 [Streptomyces sp. NBC_01294]